VINAPLSLKYAVRLQAGRAYVGFTAATGSSWQVRMIARGRGVVVGG